VGRTDPGLVLMCYLGPHSFSFFFFVLFFFFLEVKLGDELMIAIIFGAAETDCALARTFELLLIIGMVKKNKKIFVAFGQGWRFINW